MKVTQNSNNAIKFLKATKEMWNDALTAFQEDLGDQLFKEEYDDSIETVKIIKKCKTIVKDCEDALKDIEKYPQVLEQEHTANRFTNIPGFVELFCNKGMVRR